MQFSDTIKEHIEKMVCDVHDIHPVTEQDWDGIKIICCCNEFHSQCLQEVETLVGNEK